MKLQQQIILDKMVLNPCSLWLLNSLLRRLSLKFLLHSLPVSFYTVTVISSKMVSPAWQKVQPTLCLSMRITRTVLEIPPLLSQQTQQSIIRHGCSTGRKSTRVARLSRTPAQRAENFFYNRCSCVNTWSSMRVPMMKTAWNSRTHAASVSDTSFLLMTCIVISSVTAVIGHFPAWSVLGYSSVTMTSPSTWRHTQASSHTIAQSAQKSLEVPVSWGGTCGRFTECMSAQAAMCALPLAVSSVDTSVNSMQVCTQCFCLS